MTGKTYSVLSKDDSRHWFSKGVDDVELCVFATHWVINKLRSTFTRPVMGFRAGYNIFKAGHFLGRELQFIRD